MKNLIFIEDNSPTYKSRTIKNAKADATIAFAINFNTLGEKLTRLAVINNDKVYIPITVHYLQIVDERVQATINKLNKVNAKTLNIAGNGLHTLSKFYTQPEIDVFVYKFLEAVFTSSNLKTKIESIITGGQCLFGDTKISLLNDSEVEIKDLEKNKKFSAYGCRDNGEVVPIEITSLGITRYEKEYVQVQLDNDEIIKCTLDHKFMIRDGSYKEAKDLVQNDSLMPLYRRINDRGYEETLYDQVNWYQTHWVVAWFKYDEESCYKRINPKCGNVVHHKWNDDIKGFNKRDNSYDNLELMDFFGHTEYHNSLNKLKWLYHREEAEKQLANARANISPETKIKAGKYSQEKYLLPYAKSDIGRKKSSDIGKIRGKINLTKYNKSDKHKQIATKCNLERNSAKTMNRTKLINYAVKLITLGFQINEEDWNNNRPNRFTKFNKIVGQGAFDSYEEFKELIEKRIENKILINHKVKAINFIKSDSLIPFYDLSSSITSNFALYAGVFVHNSGFDEAGAKAGARLGIPTTIFAPKGWTFRDITGKDISNKQQFKERFAN